MADKVYDESSGKSRFDPKDAPRAPADPGEVHEAERWPRFNNFLLRALDLTPHVLLVLVFVGPIGVLTVSAGMKHAERERAAYTLVAEGVTAVDTSISSAPMIAGRPNEMGADSFCLRFTSDMVTVIGRPCGAGDGFDVKRGDVLSLRPPPQPTVPCASLPHYTYEVTKPQGGNDLTLVAAPVGARLVGRRDCVWEEGAWRSANPCDELNETLPGPCDQSDIVRIDKTLCGCLPPAPGRSWHRWAPVLP